MRHAILIIAHQNFEHLLYLIRYFDSDFDIYIHIDKKSRITAAEIRTLREEKQVCGIYREYAINWGGSRFLQAILFLVKKVAEKGGVNYVHLISGSDIQTRKLDNFKMFFENKPTYEYIRNFTLPTPQWSGGGLIRLTHYHLNDYLNLRIPRNARWQHLFVRMQDKWGIRRKISTKLPQLYGGGNWWSLSIECVNYVAAYTRKHKRLLKRLRFSFAADEIYIQTVIMNSPFAEQVVNNHLRYIDWRYRNRNIPANLDISDLSKITNSPCLFARKIEFPVSKTLIEQLKKQLE